MKALDQAGYIIYIADFECYWLFGDVDVLAQEDLAKDVQIELAEYFGVDAEDEVEESEYWAAPLALTAVAEEIEELGHA